MKHLRYLLILILLPLSSSAQDLEDFLSHHYGKWDGNMLMEMPRLCYPVPPDRTIYTEIGGPGIWGSVNYEHLLYWHSWFHLYGRIGIGYHRYSAGPGRSHNVVFPVTLNIKFFQGKHHLDIGVGGSFLARMPLNEHNWGFMPNPTASIAYRLDHEYGIFFRAGINFVVIPTGEGGPITTPFWPGIAFGHSF